jgi:hypothetical protein
MAFAVRAMTGIPFVAGSALSRRVANDLAHIVSQALLNFGFRLSPRYPLLMASLEFANETPLGPILLSIPWDDPHLNRHCLSSLKVRLGLIRPKP